MRVIIVYKSIHHQNTARVASAMAQAIGAECRPLEETDAASVKEYDLIGFGSGIYFSAHHEDLLHFVSEIGNLKGKKFFVFSTSGFDELVSHEQLKAKLENHGAEVVGEFKCGGWDTYGPFAAEGGLQQGRPDRVDLQNAADFAREMTERVGRGVSRSGPASRLA